jgi:HAE1 family hydrophobic/amphiphilic exporter-1
MFLSNLSIKRPIFATVMMLALVTLGIFSYRRLAIDMFPDVEIPVVSVVTKFPGSSPETVERELSKRIEEAVNPISGVKHVMSTSRESVSLVVVEFNLEVKINEASQEARAKINAMRGDLPQGIEEPIIQKLDFSTIPIICWDLSLTGVPRISTHSSPPSRATPFWMQVARAAPARMVLRTHSRQLSFRPNCA